MYTIIWWMRTMFRQELLLREAPDLPLGHNRPTPKSGEVGVLDPLEDDLHIFGNFSDQKVQFEFLWLDFAGSESLTGLMVHCNRWWIEAKPSCKYLIVTNLNSPRNTSFVFGRKLIIPTSHNNGSAFISFNRLCSWMSYNWDDLSIMWCGCDIYAWYNNYILLP